MRSPIGIKDKAIQNNLYLYKCHAKYAILLFRVEYRIKFAKIIMKFEGNKIKLNQSDHL